MSSISSEHHATRFQTNPILCFEDWLRQHFCSGNSPASRAASTAKLQEWQTAGIEIPVHAIKRWEANRWVEVGLAGKQASAPRVVGLLFDPWRKVALVNPLIAVCRGQITCSPLLPFTPITIQSLLVRLCEHLGPRIPGSLPEAFGFDFRESIGEDCTGNSMDVAAVLSALDAMTNQTTGLFAAACSVVEPGPAGTLQPVGFVSEKLNAFLREYDRGSLLVTSPLCKFDECIRAAFDTAWEVGSLTDFATKIGEIPDVASRLTRKDPVGPAQMGAILSRLRYLDETRDNQGVVRLCERVDKCGFGDNVVLYDRIRVHRRHADALRHLGRHRDSLEGENRINTLLDRCGSVISSDELLGHAVSRAAAMIDACDFAGALKQLENWLTECNDDPQRFTGQNRVELLNTAARVLVLLESDGWESHFEDSIDIQRQIDRASIRRTEGYLLQGFLRFNRLDYAEALLRRHEQALSGDSLNDGFTHFYRCDLERRRGNLWPGLSDQVPEWPGYTGAFALQAAARQRGRDAAEAIRLLDRAEQQLCKVCPDEQNILRLIAGAIALTRAGFSGDRPLWEQSRDWIDRHVRALGEVQHSYFGAAITRLGDEPNRKAAERLLSLLPYL